MVDLQPVRKMLRQLLVQRGDLEPFTDDEPLLSTGRLQSIDGVELVVFLEENFGIDFAAIGFEQTALDSVANIGALIQRAGRS
jgi:acyl carrier protein